MKWGNPIPQPPRGAAFTPKEHAKARHPSTWQVGHTSDYERCRICWPDRKDQSLDE